MKKILLIAITIILSFGASAQNISGIIKDDNDKPLSGATATLQKAKDSSIVKVAITNKEGVFSLPNIKEGKYFISSTHIGFAKQNTNIFDFNGKEFVVPSLTLAKATKQLSEVTVVSKKPMIEVKADKTIFNIEGSINATGTDAFELLRKSPGVMIDKDDNVSLSGKNGVQIYIDGRPSPLSGKDLADFLRSVQSSQIEAIELITNPSAKYDAAGNAGIINFKLTKSKLFGTNGSANAGYAIGTYSKYSAGLNLNNRNKKTNLFGTYNYNNNKNINSLSIYRDVVDTIFDQSGYMLNKNQTHNFKTGLDFYANKYNTFGIIVNGGFTTNDIINNGTTPTYYKPSNTLVRTLEANNSAVMNNNNININVNYRHTDSSGRELNIDANYGRFDIKNDQQQPNNYYDKNNNFQYSRNYNMISTSIINISNIKADFEQSFKGGKIETGAKISYVNTTNDFQRFDVVGNSKTFDTSRSNRFDYKENINAAYFNFSKQYKGFMIQLGVRVENSNITGQSTGNKKNGNGYVPYDSTFERKYTNLFPSAAITFNKNPMSQWGLSYSRRIDRPAYQDLNPFEFKLDEYTFQKGNTLLTPQYTNSFSLTNTYKYKLNTTLNYSHVSDVFTQLIDTAEKSKSFITKKNLAEQDIVSISMSYPLQIKQYSAFFSLNANYSHYKNSRFRCLCSQSLYATFT
jgi:iron complex outermembrane recepter protein